MPRFAVDDLHSRIDIAPFNIGERSVKTFFNIAVVTMTMVPPGKDISHESKVS
jgi:hypothetical protein